MSLYRVAAPVVQVSIGSHVRILGRGTAVPEGVADDTIKRLVAKGMLVEVADPVDEEAEKAAADKAAAEAAEAEKVAAEKKAADEKAAADKAAKK